MAAQVAPMIQVQRTMASASTPLARARAGFSATARM